MRLPDRCGICGASIWCGRPCANRPASPNKPEASPNTGSRNARWRDRNLEAYRAYMRDYMRRRRAK
jgi:hypothetical protein